jgi:hypothetical protein
VRKSKTQKGQELNLQFDPKFKAIAGDWFNGPLAIDPSYLDYMVETINAVELIGVRLRIKYVQLDMRTRYLVSVNSLFK